MKKKTKKGKAHYVWERGYRSHTLWLGRQCVGRITLHGNGAGLLYHCQTGTLEENMAALRDAKQWVIAQAVYQERQCRLF